MKPYVQASDSTDETAATPEEMQQAEIRHEIEETQVASNCLRAVGDLWLLIDAREQAALLSLMREMEQTFFASKVRQQTSELLKTIDQPE